MIRFSDIWFEHNLAKQKGMELLDFYIIKHLEEHFRLHNGTFDENGEADVTMSGEQLKLCIDNEIREMTLPAKFLFRIFTG